MFFRLCYRTNSPVNKECNNLFLLKLCAAESLKLTYKETSYLSTRLRLFIRR